MSIIVRKAELTDIGWMTGQLKEFSRFFGSKRELWSGDLEYSRKFLSVLIEKHVAMIAEFQHEEYGHRRPVGFIAGVRSNHPLNPGISLLSELFWWVMPEMRRSRAGLMLLNEFTGIGKETADWVVLSLETKSLIRDEHLTKRGFKLYERSYLMEVA